METLLLQWFSCMLFRMYRALRPGIHIVQNAWVHIVGPCANMFILGASVPPAGTPRAPKRFCHDGGGGLRGRGCGDPHPHHGGNLWCLWGVPLGVRGGGWGLFAATNFGQDAGNKGFTYTGLWKYSQFPNYFGEMTLWASRGLCCFSTRVQEALASTSG